MSSLTVTQSFFLGVMAAYTPSLIVLAVLLWRYKSGLAVNSVGGCSVAEIAPVILTEFLAASPQRRDAMIDEQNARFDAILRDISDRLEMQPSAAEFEKLRRSHDALYAALAAAASAIRDFDEGDPKNDDGWKHDELRNAWLAAVVAMSKAESFDG